MMLAGFYSGCITEDYLQVKVERQLHMVSTVTG